MKSMEGDAWTSLLPMEDKSEKETKDSDDIKDITHRMYNLMGIRSKENSEDENSEFSYPLNSDSKEIFIPAVDASKKISEKVDKAWARELYEIRKEDREAILDALHGVQSRAVPETPSMIEESLQKMSEEISRRVSSATSPTERKLVRGHVRAVSDLDSKYVIAPEFRLRFLRAEFFDISKSAIRYLRCLNHFYEFFGDVSLKRPLCLSDLSDRERGFLESGCMQSLISRDKMGRRLLVTHAKSIMTVPLRERHRCTIYLVCDVLAEDEETQLHGLTAVTFLDLKGRPSAVVPPMRTRYENGRTNVPEWNEEEKSMFHTLTQNKFAGHKLYAEFNATTPIRSTSIHICMPDERLYHLFKAIYLGLLPKVWRAATRIHTGSDLESNYDLIQFGIPVGDLPVSSKGGIKSKSLQKFLSARKAIDSFRKNHAEKLGVDYYRFVPTPDNESEGENNGKESTQLPPITKDFCPGTDCPESNCVVFGDRITYNFSANTTFREYLRVKEQCHGHLGVPTASATPSDATNSAAITKSKAMRLRVEVLDQIIDELCATSGSFSSEAGDTDSSSESSGSPGRRKGFKFAIYDKEAGWYRYFDPIRNEADRIELRKRISQAMRDERKRAIKQWSNHQAAQERGSPYSAEVRPAPPTIPPGHVDPLPFGQAGQSSDTDNGADDTEFSLDTSGQFLNDAKRFKRDHCWEDGPCGGGFL